MRHGKGLARPGHTQQNLIVFTVLNALGQLSNGLRLITGRLKLAMQLEHTPIIDGRAFRRDKKLLGIDRIGCLHGNYIGRVRGCWRVFNLAFGGAVTILPLPGEQEQE